MQEPKLSPQSNPPPPRRTFWWVMAILLTVLMVRGLAATVVPIMDKTEARYAEIARKMVETDNWIMPQFDYGVPFWGKPPLSTWLSAGGIELFGAGEFGPRAPILLLSTALLILFWRFAKHNTDVLTAHLATVMLATSAIFLVSAGAVMTDMTLLFSLFLMISACWNFTREWHPRHGRWMFAGIGIGLLAKGLTVLALGGLPIAVWLTLSKKWKPFLTRLPWGTGLAITTVIALPWYIAAEMKTPGFLQYFFIGEHFNRFLVPGWKGDRYGFAHAQPLGMIWAYYMMGVAPWTLLVPAYWLVTRRKPNWMRWKEAGPQREFAVFLLCWALVPALFLTFARNIIWTYSLPAAPAIALLLAMSLQHPKREDTAPARPFPWVLTTAAVLMTIAFGGVVYLYEAQKSGVFLRFTQKAIVAEYQLRCQDDPDCTLWYFHDRVFSAEYYLKGHLQRTKRLALLTGTARKGKHDYLVGRDLFTDPLQPADKDHLKLVKRFGDTALWRIER